MNASHKPFPAFWIRPPVVGGYSDAASVQLVQVQSYDRETMMARVTYRAGNMPQERCVPFCDLASDAETAGRKLTVNLLAMLSRAALPAMPVKTGSTAEPSPAPATAAA